MGNRSQFSSIYKKITLFLNGGMLTHPDSFTIITYSNFIETVQRLDLDRSLREWTMLLWARYCATVLSDPLNEQIDKAYKDNEGSEIIPPCEPTG